MLPRAEYPVSTNIGTTGRNKGGRRGEGKTVSIFFSVWTSAIILKLSESLMSCVAGASGGGGAASERKKMTTDLDG